MPKAPIIHTVLGAIPASELGWTLPHEHILVDFGGAATAGKHRYDAENVIEVMLPYLLELRKQGITGFFECTPNFLGRDVEIFRTLAERSGLHIVTNTGLYNKEFLPDYAQHRSAECLAEAWIREFEDGIDSTKIRPGFIKTAVLPQPLNDLERKLIRAAAITHNATGLTIATHTCVADAAESVLNELERGGVNPSRWIFVHAHREEKNERLLTFANAGAWIELDGLAFGGEDNHRDKLLFLLERGFEDRILLSHDGGWYHVGEPNGGTVIPFTRMYATFLPLLKECGVSDAIIEKIMRINPTNAFAV
ncbi:aryldialkylphosphatase [Candidatus Moduliflexus flocculans]|uniref:Aryldialkylphosphatase n=1 Tax=Candidatus Moduliflexus flocculans TaxID=1499966 RepID=A0A0S6VSX0_9BACT|nr:aryldialkylphosphatase [Candidatus Moduliflexus flocculans]